MNPILKLIIDALVKYLNDHPDQVKILIEAALDSIVKAVKEANQK
jgi:hypothetical protein